MNETLLIDIGAQLMSFRSLAILQKVNKQFQSDIGRYMEQIGTLTNMAPNIMAHVANQENRCALCFKRNRAKWSSIWKITCHQKCIRELLINEYYLPDMVQWSQFAPFQIFEGWMSYSKMTYDYRCFLHKPCPVIPNEFSIEDVRHTAKVVKIMLDHEIAQNKIRYSECLVSLAKHIKARDLTRKRKLLMKERVRKLNLRLTKTKLGVVSDWSERLPSISRFIFGDFFRTDKINTNVKMTHIIRMIQDLNEVVNNQSLMNRFEDLMRIRYPEHNRSFQFTVSAIEQWCNDQDRLLRELYKIRVAINNKAILTREKQRKELEFKKINSCGCSPGVYRAKLCIHNKCKKCCKKIQSNKVCKRHR